MGFNSMMNKCKLTGPPSKVVAAPDKPKKKPSKKPKGPKGSKKPAICPAAVPTVDKENFVDVTLLMKNLRVF